MVLLGVVPWEYEVELDSLIRMVHHVSLLKASRQCIYLVCNKLFPTSVIETRSSVPSTVHENKKVVDLSET